MLTIGWESLVIFAICLADTLSTLMLYMSHRIVEANPLMARCLQSGTTNFCMVKMFSVLFLIGIAEWHRQRNPDFVQKALRSGIVGYTIIYVCSVIAVNFR